MEALKGEDSVECYCVEDIMVCDSDELEVHVVPYLVVEMPDAPLLHMLQGSILKTQLQSVSSIASTSGVVEPICVAGGGVAEHEEVPASEVRARRACSLPRALVDLCTLAELYLGNAWSFCWSSLVQMLCRP